MLFSSTFLRNTAKITQIAFITRSLLFQLSTLPILASEDIRRNDDEECSVRQIVRHVCTALKRYFEAHLFLKTENTRRAFMRDTILPDAKGQNLILPSYKVRYF